MVAGGRHDSWFHQPGLVTWILPDVTASYTKAQGWLPNHRAGGTATNVNPDYTRHDIWLHQSTGLVTIS